VFGVVVIGSSPVVYTLLGRALRRAPAWSASRTTILWATAITWVGLLAFPVSLGLYRSLQPLDGLDLRILVSVINRLMILTYSGWLGIVAVRALERPSGAETSPVLRQ